MKASDFEKSLEKTYHEHVTREDNFLDTSCQKCGHVPGSQKHLCDWGENKNNPVENMNTPHKEIDAIEAILDNLRKEWFEFHGEGHPFPLTFFNRIVGSSIISYGDARAAAERAEQISFLEERKRVISAQYDHQMEERVHRRDEVDRLLAHISTPTHSDGDNT